MTGGADGSAAAESGNLEGVVDVAHRVDEEQLRLLLSVQAESHVLDYKRTLKLDSTEGIVQLAKDVGAMGSGPGGHIVIGADELGGPAQSVDERLGRLLDQATLQAKLSAYIAPGFHVLSTTHQIDGHRYGVIHVGPHDDGLSLFIKDGTFRKNDGTDATVFTVSDVFVRHGSASERWRPQDIRAYQQRVRAAERAVAREEYSELLQRQLAAIAGSNALSTAPASALTWDLEPAALVEAIIEQRRRGDSIPLKLLLARAAGDMRSALTAQDTGAPAALLDRMAAIAAIGLVIEEDDITQRAIEALAAGYDLGFVARGPNVYPPERLWLDVLVRVYALGGLAVRKRRWNAVRWLALHRPASDEADRYPSWLRHGFTMATRAQLLRDDRWRQLGLSLLTVAQEYIIESPALRPDLDGVDGEPLAGMVLDSLAQFDLLAVLASLLDPEPYRATPYPHFARLYARRSDPAALALISDQEARDSLAPSTDDALADALRVAAQLTDSAEFFSIDGWDGYEDRRIARFLDEHPSVE